MSLTTEKEQAENVNNFQQTQTETGIDSSAIKHEITLFAEPIVKLSNFTITNSLLTSWLAVFIIVVLAVLIKRKIRAIPHGLQNYIEAILESAINLADSITGSRHKTLRFFPIIIPLFFFILINNWLGLLPGVGSIGFIEHHQGEQLFIPLFRGGTADLNTTLALAIGAVTLTHLFGIMAVSFSGHFNKFIGYKLFLEIPKKLFKEKDITILLVNPIKFFVGLIEAVGELAKIASLSFRLFGNIFAGEVLLTVMMMIFAYFLPIPFIFLEIIIGVIQALIFSVLTLVFLSIMTTDHESVDH